MASLAGMPIHQQYSTFKLEYPCQTKLLAVKLRQWRRTRWRFPSTPLLVSAHLPGLTALFSPAEWCVAGMNLLALIMSLTRVPRRGERNGTVFIKVNESRILLMRSRNLRRVHPVDAGSQPGDASWIERRE